MIGSSAGSFFVEEPTCCICELYLEQTLSINEEASDGQKICEETYEEICEETYDNDYAGSSSCAAPIWMRFR